MCPEFGTSYLRHAKDAVRDILGTWNNQIAFGFAYFPSALCVPMSSFLCTPTVDAAVDVSGSSSAAILDVLGPLDCCGGTPLHGSLDFTRRYYDDLDDGHAHHVLLVTDGAPNCNAGLNRFTCTCTDSGIADCGRFDDALNCLDDARAIEAATELSGAGVQVHVLGLADAAIMWSRVMDDIAEAGGTERAVLVEEAEAIAEAMDGIAGDVAPCRFTLVPGEVADPSAVYFLVDGVEVPRDPGRTDGWDWVNAWTVDFYGPACDRIVEGGVSVVTARINCEAP
ncbi:MAG: VWA domain-containing protein [Deltaproteobacteria bacterium]|nr:VWA domain-containing protein [Deltaproteobacteria bacterium]